MKTRVVLLPPTEASLSVPFPIGHRCNNCSNHPGCDIQSTGKGKIDAIFMEMIENHCLSFAPNITVVINDASVIRSLDAYVSGSNGMLLRTPANDRS